MCRRIYIFVAKDTEEGNAIVASATKLHDEWLEELEEHGPLTIESFFQEDMKSKLKALQLPQLLT